MGTRGPKPKPTKLKKLAGTYRADRAPDHEPRPEPGPMPMPRGILPRSARKLWRELVPELQELGLATPLDAPMLALTCIWGGVVLDAARMIRDAEERRTDGQGLVTRDDRGRERKNRALTALRAASSELRQLSRAFGLTPADRAGIEVPPDEEGPSLADMLFAMTEMGDDD